MKKTQSATVGFEYGEWGLKKEKEATEGSVIQMLRITLSLQPTRKQRP